MKIRLSRDSRDNLLIHQTAVPLFRYVIGIPLLLLGAFFLFSAISSLILLVKESRWETLPGPFLLFFMAAIVVPLGWWLVLSTHWILLDRAHAEIKEVSDWRLGRKARSTPLSRFHSVSVVTEPILSASSTSSNSTPTFCHKVQLTPSDPDEQAAIDLGMAELNNLNHAVAVAQEISEYLKLNFEDRSE